MGAFYFLEPGTLAGQHIGIFARDKQSPKERQFGFRKFCRWTEGATDTFTAGLKNDIEILGIKEKA